MMQASDAGLTQDTTAEQEPAGNGIVVVCGIFEPGAVVELYRVDSDRVLRAQGGELVGRRITNDAREVGFDGLAPGDLFFATGYTAGEYKEIRCRAQDPSSGVTLFQQPVQPSPTTLGTQQTPVADAPPAAPADVGDGVGLPAGVSSPILAGDASTATPGSPPARDDAGVSPGDVDVIAGSAAAQPEALEVYAYEGAGEPDTAEWGKAEIQEKVTPENDGQEPRALYRFIGDKAALEVFPPEGFTLYEGATEPVPTATDTAPADNNAPGAPADAGPSQTTDGAPPAAPDAAPVSDPNPPAPDAGTPDASESSGTGAANGGAVEDPSAAASSAAPGAADGSASAAVATDGASAADASGAAAQNDVVAEAPADVAAAPAADAQGQPTADAAPADVASAAETAPADAAPAADSSAATDAAWGQLAQQALDLGVTNTATMSDDELRQAIIEKNATPVV